MQDKEYHETIKKVLLWIMMADGVVEEEELLQVAKVYNNLTQQNLTLIDIHKEAKQTNYLKLEKELESAFVKLYEQHRLQILTAAMSVAAADGEFQIEEQVLISCLIKKLCLPQSKAHQVIKGFFDIQLTDTVEFKCPTCQRIAILKKEIQPLGKQIKCKSCKKDFILSPQNMDGSIAISPKFYIGITVFFILQLWISISEMPQSKVFLSAFISMAATISVYFLGTEWIKKKYPHFWNSPTKYFRNRCSLLIPLILLGTTLGIYFALGKMLLTAIFLCLVAATVAVVSLRQKLNVNFMGMFLLWIFFSVVFSISKNTYHTTLFKEVGEKIENCQNYIAEYPQGLYVSRALKKIDRLRYQEVKKKNTIIAYEEFLQKYPRSRNASAVKARIEKLKAQDWNWVKKQDRMNIYKMHLEYFPNSTNKKFIEKRIIDLEVDDISRGTYSSIPSVTEYQRTFGDTAQVTITNQTQYIMTILYSGRKTSKKMILSPWKTGLITLVKGTYKVAVSVSASSVNNYYGVLDITGSYSTRYYITNSFRKF